MTGHAAGIAAALSANSGTRPRDLAVLDIQSALLARCLCADAADTMSKRPCSVFTMRSALGQLAQLHGASGGENAALGRTSGVWRAV